VKPTPWNWLAAAGLLVLPLLLATVPGAQAATSRTLAITTATAHPLVAFADFDGNPPKLYDIDGDGQLEIIAQNDNNWVYVFDSKTGALLSELTTTFPTGWAARTFNGPEVSMFTTDGKMHLIVANSAATITSFLYDPLGSSRTHFAFVKEWERRLNDCFANPGMDSKPVLADLDRDGRFEILGNTEEFGVYALRSTDGSLYWKNCLGGGNAEPTVADVNLDGWPDVVHVSDGGTVSLLNGRSGQAYWGYWAAGPFNLGSGSMPVGATIAQLDGKAGLDIVVGARDSHDGVNFTNDHALLLALSGGGSLLWARQDPAGNPLTYTHPVVVDADKDGTPEVYWGDWNTIGHKPPANEADAWKRTGPAHFYRYANNGSLVWRQTLDTFWSNKDLVLADVDADGVQEVLANGPDATGKDGIWYLNANTGAAKTFVSTSPWKVSRAPVIGDLWKTGTMQWVVEVGPQDPSVGYGILVYDTAVAYSSVYSHLPYPVLGTPLPPPNGTFDATFRIKSPGEWWQEVSIAPNPARAVSAVDVRIGGGPWEPMKWASWGAWTSSLRAPKNSTVEFLAHDPANAVSQSLPFTWMDGVLVKGSTTPSPTPTPTPVPFGATYAVAPGSNEWWIEVKVGATGPVSAVDATVDGGAWKPLTLRTWGNWASSFFVAKCSAVQFRSSGPGGAQILSQTLRWLDDGTCGKPTAFAATFAPQAIGNDWWIETQVKANHPLTSVDVSLNGGAWTPLTLQSWGNWAKSLHAPNGTPVVFRATDNAGATITSGTYTWV
jgi:hypothetical protein